MSNITSLEYRIRFLEDVVFKDDPEIALFKVIFIRLKNILCINHGEDCISCKYKKCLYRYMSAGDFALMDSMPIKINKPLFSKRFIKKNELLELNCIFLGNAAIHIDFFHFALKDLEVRGLFKEEYKFCIEDVSIENVNLLEDNTFVNSITVLTPIDNIKNIFEVEKEKIERLNKLYGIIDKKMPCIAEAYDFRAIQFHIRKSLHMGSNRINQEGCIGKLQFRTPVSNNSFLQLLKIIGMGKYYGIGGGQIKLGTI